MSNETKRAAFIAAHGTLDWAYPPFILGSTAAALDMEVQIFFTFYGLLLLKKDLDLPITPIGNPAMPMPIPVPNLLTSNIPGMDMFAGFMMKQMFKKHGVASLPELREACLESGVKLVACQMTMDVFGFKKEDFIDGIEVGGAATFLSYAADSDIQLFM